MAYSDFGERAVDQGGIRRQAKMTLSVAPYPWPAATQRAVFMAGVKRRLTEESFVDAGVKRRPIYKSPSIESKNMFELENRCLNLRTNDGRR